MNNPPNKTTHEVSLDFKSGVKYFKPNRVLILFISRHMDDIPRKEEDCLNIQLSPWLSLPPIYKVFRLAHSFILLSTPPCCAGLAGYISFMGQSSSGAGVAVLARQLIWTPFAKSLLRWFFCLDNALTNSLQWSLCFACSAGQHIILYVCFDTCEVTYLTFCVQWNFKRGTLKYSTPLLKNRRLSSRKNLLIWLKLFTIWVILWASVYTYHVFWFGICLHRWVRS